MTAVVTDRQRLESRLRVAAWRMRDANEELHKAEVAHRLAVEALEEFERTTSNPQAVETEAKQ